MQKAKKRLETKWRRTFGTFQSRTAEKIICGLTNLRKKKTLLEIASILIIMGNMNLTLTNVVLAHLT